MSKNKVENNSKNLILMMKYSFELRVRLGFCDLRISHF